MKPITALLTKQWLPEWDALVFSNDPPRRKPRPYFLTFTMNVYDLKRLCGVYRRDASKPPTKDMNVQRGHMSERSQEILRYVQDGFPLSRIKKERLVAAEEQSTLRMPGWLPTAVVVNILEPGINIGGSEDAQLLGENSVSVDLNEEAGTAILTLPSGADSEQWLPLVYPMEVIDGQHRLWAFESPPPNQPQWPKGLREKLQTLSIPVVAFHGLDRTWQAYLFYTINHLPKRIDVSQIFDLYPLLRNEDWLLRFSGPLVYRETRAQELVSILWEHPQSPWKERILRLGGRAPGKVTQGAFVRSLLSSLIKSWQGTGTSTRIGGLFGAPTGVHQIQIGWGIDQQAAFLIVIWERLRQKVVASDATWAIALLHRATDGLLLKDQEDRQSLFSGPDTLLATDQGVRAFLCVMNDLLVVAIEEGTLKLDAWDFIRNTDNSTTDSVNEAIASFLSRFEIVVSFIDQITLALADFDWRLSSIVDRSTDRSAYDRQSSYRGSSGYRELRRNLLTHLRDKHNVAVAGRVIERLNFESDED